MGETSLLDDVGAGNSLDEEAGFRCGQVQAFCAAASLEAQQDRTVVALGLQQEQAAFFSVFGPVQSEQHCAAGGDTKRQNANSIRSAGMLKS